MYTLSRISGILSVVFAILGIIFWFINPLVTVICAVLTLIDSVIQIKYGGQNGFATEILEIIIGSAIAIIAKLNYLNTVSFVLCIGTFLLWFVGIISIIISSNSYRKRR